MLFGIVLQERVIGALQMVLPDESLCHSSSAVLAESIESTTGAPDL